MHLFVPPRLFLDTAAIVEISWIRAGRTESIDPRREQALRHIWKAISTGTCSLVYCHLLGYEWVRPGNLARAMEYARVFDAATTLLSVGSDADVYLIEILEEIRRLRPEFDIPVFAIVSPYTESDDLLLFRQRVHPSVARKAGLPPLLRLYTPTTVQKEVTLMFNVHQHDPGMLQNGLSGFYEGVRGTRDRAAKGKFSDKDKRSWVMRQFAFEELVTTLDSGADAQSLLLELDFSRCRAISAWFGTYWQYLRAGQKATDSDLIDHGIVPAVVYSDLALVDKRLWQFLTAGCPSLAKRVFRRPEDLAASLK
jgi:hypothetical protein